MQVNLFLGLYRGYKKFYTTDRPGRRVGGKKTFTRNRGGKK